MSAPTVACVMLANGRPEMVARAVKSFRAQTYDDAQLVIWDTGGPGASHDSKEDRIVHCWRSRHANLSIGALRNEANSAADDLGADIICHWDSDDWSHPNRIAEQVALLQSSGAECVGYNEMLFWVDAIAESWIWRENIKNYAVGTSMCYWRSTWERAPFPDYSEGCDDLYWAHGDKKKGIAAIKIVSSAPWDVTCTGEYSDGPNKVEPMMIASIHGGNTCAKIDAKASAWRRVPEWDSYCREEMKL